MEDVIQTYMLPYDPRYPVVCFDEACKQLFGEARPAKYSHSAPSFEGSQGVRRDAQQAE